MDFAYHYISRIQRWGNIKKCVYGLNLQLFRSCSLNIIYPEFSPARILPFLFKTPQLIWDIYAIFNWVLMQKYIELYLHICT